MTDGRKKKIGLFGGSFDPVHSGHLMVASFIAQNSDLDEVWLNLSPCNPLKDKARESNDEDRLNMLRIAVEGIKFLSVCDVELTMPYPSYTISTLRLLRERYPDCDFTLVVGSDNWNLFDRWKDSEAIIKEFGVIVYPRPGYPVDFLPEGVAVVEAPLIQLSSTFIRKNVKEGKDMNFFLPQAVYQYIIERNLYK